MELQAKQRLMATKLPSWAERKAQSTIWSLVQGGKLTGRHTVSLTSDREPTWKVEPDGVIDVRIPRQYFDACKRLNAGWALLHSVQHELWEAKVAINLARKQYPSMSPYVAAENKQHLGGEAHALTCEELDGLTSDEYDKQLQLEYSYLGL